MFDHISIGVKSLEKSKQFYDAALTPLGFECQSEMGKMAGYGEEKATFWIAEVEHPVLADMKSGLHFCFTASSREAVEAFYAGGMANGGTDNGPPGVRPEYARFYYAAFIMDPDGYRLEAFFHMPE